MLLISPLVHADALGGKVGLNLWAQRSDAQASKGGELIDKDSGQKGDMKIDGVVPLGYGAVRFDLPFSGWYIQADDNYIKWNNDKVVDLRAALGWKVLAGLGLELGYRYMDIDYEAGSGILESKTDGVYGGVFWDF
ncbi:MAG: hypothetical protein V7709_16580 [Halioglobus sp.]